MTAGLPEADSPAEVPQTTATTESPNSSKSPRLWLQVAKVFGWLVLLGLAIPATLRILWVEVGPSAVIVSFIPWITMITVVFTVVLLIARWWPHAATGIVLSIIGLSWLVPLYIAAPDPPAQRRVNVGTVNTLFGHANPDEIVAMVRDHDLDVLSVQELTGVELARLNTAGLTRLLPYSRALPAEGAAGTGLWSRTPLTKVSTPDTTQFAVVEATTTTRTGVTMRVVAAHPAAPDLLHTGPWRRDAAALYEVMQNALSDQGVVVLAGDLNATLDHPPIRRLEGLGLVDAVTAAGAGFHPTYPNDCELIPLVAIDHVMARGLVARSADVVSIDRSDHKALVTSMVG